MEMDTYFNIINGYTREVEESKCSINTCIDKANTGAVAVTSAEA